MRKLYIIPTLNCNLKCPHCFVRNGQETYDEKKILEFVNNSNFDEYVLFGGEPLLYRERFFSLVQSKKISTVSTNLLLLDEQYIETIKENNITVATSWNPRRFTTKQYSQWLDNLSLLENHNINCTIMITLTEDLIEIDPLDFYNQYVSVWDKIKSIKYIKFEPLVDEDKTEEFYEMVDDWLCLLHQYWKTHIINILENELENHFCKCENVYTLYPSGDLKHGCPMYKRTKVNMSCFGCNLSHICKPCVLQQHCVYPKKLYNLLKEIK